MTNGKLYGSATNFRTQKVLIAAKYGNTNVVLVNEQPSFPVGSTPAYEGDDGVQLFGAAAIAYHVGGSTVRGQHPDHFAQVLQWVEWSEAKLLPNVLGYVLPSVSAVENMPVDQAKSDLLAQLHHLNDYLLTRTYLVDERISLADISVALDLVAAYQHVLDGTVRAKLTNLNRWFQTIINQPHVKSVVGEVTLCQKVCQFDAKKYNELVASKKSTTTGPAHPRKDQHSERKSESKKDQPKSEEKKKDKKKKTDESHDDADEMDAADEAMAQEPKATDPFATMPKGTFDLDAFKRSYSNEDTLTKAIPFLWANFDAEHYSIWFAEYKYPQELTLVFMSCNLINGMYQRLEKLKKNAFASVCVFGKDNESTISGVWIWRGHELVFPLSPDWQIDYESYDWKKLDPKSDATKKIVQEV